MIFVNWHMKHKLLSGLTAMVLVSSLSVSLSSRAEQSPLSEEAQAEEVTETETFVGAIPKPESADRTPETAGETTAVKVGEYQSDSQSDTQLQAIVATVLPHEWNNRQAATLYVRNIPVLTFVEQTDAVKAANPGNLVQIGTVLHQQTEKKVASPQVKQPSSDAASEPNPSDPVVRATELAAKLNELSRHRIDANSIGVRWNPEQENYSIYIPGETLVVIDSDTILPDTTQNAAEDALQATNRLRRQLGYAPPLRKIEGKSPLNAVEKAVEMAFNRRVIDAVTGWASWYGPGFHGRLTANGERFNQYELTAAHRTLPFGTTVRVTNVNNGRSVVVRINDRGPFTGGRIIDLSVAAADAIGMIGSGVAPVKVEVLAP